MNITIEELAVLVESRKAVAQATEAPWEVGKNYFIRTVTHHFTGHLLAVFPTELVLENAAWIADDGRFADALKSETFSEVEPYPANRRVIIGRGSVIDAVVVNSIPTSQK